MSHEAPDSTNTIDWDEAAIGTDEEVVNAEQAEQERQSIEKKETEKAVLDKKSKLLHRAGNFGMVDTLRPRFVDGELKSRNDRPGNEMLEVPFPTADPALELVLIPKEIGPGLSRDKTMSSDGLAIFGVLKDRATGDVIVPAHQIFIVKPPIPEAGVVCSYDDSKIADNERVGSPDRLDRMGGDPGGIKTIDIMSPEGKNATAELSKMLDAINEALTAKAEQQLRAKFEKDLAELRA